MFLRSKAIYFIIFSILEFCDILSSLWELILIKLSVIKWIIFSLNYFWINGAIQSNFQIFLSLKLGYLITLLKLSHFLWFLEARIWSLRNSIQLLCIKILIWLIRSLITIPQLVVNIVLTDLNFLWIIYLSICMRYYSITLRKRNIITINLTLLISK